MNSEFAVAVHALVYLEHKGRLVSSEELADNICTHPSRVRKVMARLKRAGLVETREGLEGGYGTASDAGPITLEAVGAALGAAYVSIQWRSGDEEKDCRIASGMAGVMDGLLGELNLLCSRHLSGITISDINEKLFAAER